jgi:hypothetical protein
MTGHRVYRHFSDAELLSSLDGELGWWHYFGLKMHLFRCWECRARNAELEAQAHRLSRVLRQDSFPGTRRVADARAAFDSWRWQLEQPQAQTARRNLTLTKMAVFAGRSALSAAAMFVILGRPSPVQRPVDTPAAPPVIHAAQPPSATMPPPAVAPARIVPKRVDRSPLELDVHYRLHRIGACTAEPVLIARRGTGRIEVSAVGPPPEREREIRVALRDLEQSGRINISITHVNQDPPTTDALGDATQKATVTPAMAESDFARRFGSPQEFARIAGLVVQDADVLYSHAWALKKHSQVPDAQGAAAAPAYWLRDVMLQEHGAKVREAAARLRHQLAVVLPPATASDSDTSAFDTATKITAILHRLFTSPPGTSQRSFEDDVLELNSLFSRLDRSLDRLFSSRPKTGELN